MADQQAQQLFSFDEVINSIPEEPPRLTFDNVLQHVPQGDPVGFVQGGPPKEYNPVQKWWMDSFGQTEEQAKAQAFNIIAISELTGQSPTEVAQDENVLKDIYEVPTVGEAVKMRAEFIGNRFNTGRDMMNAAQQFAVAYKDQDKLSLAESSAMWKEAIAMKREDPRLGSTEQWIFRSVGDLAGQLYSFAEDGYDEALFGMGIAGVVTGGNPAAMVAGGKVAFGLGVTKGIFETMLGVQTLSKVEDGMDVKSSYYSSIPTAAVLTLMEQLQLMTVLKHVPGGKKLLSEGLAEGAKKVEHWTLTKLGQETLLTGLKGTGQEMAQTIVEQLDIEITKSLYNKLTGAGLDTATIEEIIREVRDTGKEVLPGMILLGGAGSVTGYSAEKLNRAADNRAAQDRVGSAQRIGPLTAQGEFVPTLRDRQGAEVELEETLPVDENTVVVDADGAEQPSMPITPVERAEHETRQREPQVTDEEFDNLVLTPDEDLDTAIGEVLDKAQQSGDRYGDFVQNIREALGKKQAKIIESLIQQRARATNRTPEQFAEDHQLRFGVERDESGIRNASVEFIQDGETIIRAFEKATMKDVTHELSHVFRKDLNSAELAAAEQAFGVENGKWNKAAEERFADGFVQYLQDGETSNANMKAVFDKFKKWLGRLYETVAGTGIEVSPEMRQLFDIMLAESVNQDNVHRMAAAREATHTLFSKQQQKKKGKKKGKTQAERQAERLQNIIDDRQALHDALKNKVITARKAASLGQRLGYNEAKADSYAILQRAATRAKRGKERTRWRNKITKLVKEAKTKRRAGKKTGQFTADFQAIADSFIEIFSMKVKDAKELDRNMSREDVPDAFSTSDLDALKRWLIRVRANSAQLGPEALEQLHADLEGLFNDQKAIRHSQIAPLIAEVQQGKKEILESLATVRERKGLDPNEKNAYENQLKGVFGKLIDKLMFNAIYDFHGLMELLDMGLSDAFGQGFSAKFGETLDAENQSNTNREAMNTRFLMDTATVFGYTLPDGSPDIKRAERHFFEEEREERKLVVEFDELDREGNPTGKVHKLRLNKPEMRKLWMELQNEKIREQMEELGFTPVMQQTLRANLTQADIDLANAEFQMYQEYYQRVNDIYRVHEGVDLPFEEFYSPVIRDVMNVSEKGPATDLLNDMRRGRQYISAGGSVLRERVNAESMLKAQSDVDALNHYIRQMEHYIAFKDLTAKWNMFFDDAQIRAAIRDTYGPEMVTVIDKLRTNIARNGGVSAEGFDFFNSSARTIRGNLARGMVGAKIMSIPKQVTSFLAFSDGVDMGAFSTEMFNFLLNPKKNYEFMKSISPFIQNRPNRMDRDIAMLSNTSEFKDIISRKVGPSFNNLTMMFVKAGDSIAIVVGGWARYQILTKGGMSHEEALRDVELLARNTQQSSELGSLTVAQQGNEFMKLFTMFTSAQRQYAQRIVLAHVANKNNRMSREEMTKKLLLYGIALPTLFQVVAQGGISDEDDVRSAARAIMVTPLQAVPIGGHSMSYLISYLIEGHTYGRGAGNLAIFSPLERSLRGVKKMKKIDINDFSMSDILEAIRDLMAPLEYAGVPVGGVGGMAVGLSDIIEGEGGKGSLEVLGMSPYTAKKRVEK